VSPNPITEDRETASAAAGDTPPAHGRPQRPLELVVVLPDRRREELPAHAALRSASRTCSSTGSAGSTARSASSASSSE